MPSIVLNDEQAEIARGALGMLSVYDSEGNLVGQLDPVSISSDRVAELKKRMASSEPRYGSDHVRALLCALEEEWRRTGGFEEAHLQQFLDQFQAASTP